MSTISALSSAGASARPSPRSRMDEDITAAVKAGVLSQTDASAIETALDKIDSSLQSGSNGQTGTTLDPKQMKDRVDSLIDQQVKDGTLTSDQADELKAFFAAGPGGQDGAGQDGAGQDGASQDGAGAATGSTGGASAAGGARGGGGAGGAASTDTTTDTDGDGVPDYIDPQPTVYNVSDSDSTTASASKSSTDSQSGDSDGDGDDSKLSALKTFLNNLRQQQDQGTYAVGSQNQAGNGASGQIINQFA